jgi:hypothetical protein
MAGERHLVVVGVVPVGQERPGEDVALVRVQDVVLEGVLGDLDELGPQGFGGEP